MTAPFAPVSADRLKGKVAIVTGATQGLGLDIARSLIASGARVTLVDKNDASGEAVAAQLGEDAFFVKADVQRDEDIEMCIQRTLDRFEGLHILVNNACIYDDDGIESTRQQWHNTLGVNLVSAAVFSQQVLKHLQPGAVIVNMGSTGGKFGAAGRAIYPASKAAMLQLTRNIAVSFAPSGIRCVSISPAWTWSPSMEKLASGNKDLADVVGSRMHPLGRVGRGEEVGAVVAFVCSDEASWISGVDIPVDGGFTSLGPDQGKSPRYWFDEARGQV